MGTGVNAKVQARVEAVLGTLVGSGAESGLQVAVYADGQLVVDACAGTAGSPDGRPLGPATLIHGFSTGKGFTTTLVHVLAERGLIDYDTPIAHYWPEFAAHGKERVTVRHALTHTAGVPQLPVALTPAELCDWDTMCAVVAEQEPLWEPGTDSGYHGWTFGWILGETVRRVTGLTPAEALRTYVTEPLGIADELFFGLPEAELPRTAPLVEGGWGAWLASLPPTAPFRALVAPNPGVWTVAELANRRDFLLADLPAGGTTTARAAARLYAALLGEVDGVRLLPRARVKLATAVAVSGKDRVLRARHAKGLGYFLGLPEMAGELTSFGHHGSGGSIAFADRARGLSFALTRTRLVAPTNDTARLLADEVRAHLQ
ncbi:serine hydrolase domain-containing protein [Streptomyces melanogenes]|uniref:serine hydrolase domain-containing protein n=1 Tax=Streptomyces melanogenes TaxID=67326 RepID=UPI0019B42367|nr:serine hydrolase domain-containing protein [Streptomyces melanogenes]GGP46119.1 esterase [Streptomyces melanogenes]